MLMFQKSTFGKIFSENFQVFNFREKYFRENFFGNFRVLNIWEKYFRDFYFREIFNSGLQYSGERIRENVREPSRSPDLKTTVRRETRTPKKKGIGISKRKKK